MPDPYDEIHRLIREDQSDAALVRVLDSGGTRLNKPYDDDNNHGWYVVGNIYFKRGDFEKAAEAFKRSIEDCPDDHEALLAIGNCYDALGEPITSEYYLREALKFRDKPEIIYNLACSLFDQEKFSEAIVFFSRISEENEKLFQKSRKNICLAKIKIENAEKQKC